MPTTIYDSARGQRVPVHVWARDASEETIAQLVAIASRPVRRASRRGDGRCARRARRRRGDGVRDGTLGGAARARGRPRVWDRGDAALGRGRASSIGASLERIIDSLDRAIPAGDAVHRGKGVAVPDALHEGALSTEALRARAMRWRRSTWRRSGEEITSSSSIGMRTATSGSSCTRGREASAPPSHPITCAPRRRAIPTCSRRSMPRATRGARTSTTSTGRSPSRARIVTPSPRAPFR